jgi:hypothetical protein
MRSTSGLLYKQKTLEWIHTHLMYAVTTMRFGMGGMPFTETGILTI